MEDLDVGRAALDGVQIRTGRAVARLPVSHKFLDRDEIARGVNRDAEHGLSSEYSASELSNSLIGSRAGGLEMLDESCDGRAHCGLA